MKSKNKKQALTYGEIKNQMTVVDSNGNTGRVSMTHDIHNILVNYIHGGSGLYCMDKNCKEYDPLYACINGETAQKGD